MLIMILLILALVCFIAAAAGYPPAGVAIGWLGAAFVTLTLLIPGVH